MDLKGVVLLVGNVEIDNSAIFKSAAQKGLKIEFMERIPNSINEISERLYSLSNLDYDIIFTIGGTGIGDEDVVPEATDMVIDKKIPGLEYFIFKEVVSTALEGMFTRIVAGLRKGTLIVNLPKIGYERLFSGIVEAIVKIKNSNCDRII